MLDFIIIIKYINFKRNSSLIGQFRYKNGAIAPIFIGGVNYQLDTHLVGSMQYKTSIGFSSSMTTSLVYEKDDLNLNASLQLSVKNTYLSKIIKTIKIIIIIIYIIFMIPNIRYRSKP
jgi:hypothetical protein